MAFDKLVHKDVLLKIIGLPHSTTGKVAAADETGLWVIDKSLALELASLVKEPGIPGFLGDAPAVFVPFYRMEWLMAAGPTVQS